MRKITINRFHEKNVEFVERKGIGHPDTICDSICESASRELSLYYLSKFGNVLHHNLDKGLLIAGKSKTMFGGGHIIEPIGLIIAGKATGVVDKQFIPVNEIVSKSAYNYMKNFRYIHPRYFQVTVDFREGAENLKEVFRAKLIANDTSFGASHAPLSETERIVLEISELLGSVWFLRKFKAVGEDTKVMAYRADGEIRATVAAAFVDKHISSMHHYLEQKEKVKDYIKKQIKSRYNIHLDLNTLDNPKLGKESGIYLTCTGLSAENGDDGQVGRGNRANGLITPMRPMSLEATAGKNINHPGKLYQVLSKEIAKRISLINGVEECNVYLLTQIGKRLDEPVVNVEVSSKHFEKSKRDVERAVNEVLNDIERIQVKIIEGKYRLF